MPARPALAQGTFDHRMAVFDTDEEFLAAALPFLAEGLAAPDEPPPVAIAAPPNSACCATPSATTPGASLRPAHRVVHRLRRQRDRPGRRLPRRARRPHGRIHLLMEPDWSGRAGRSARETSEWIRYEAFANLLFAPLATTALCAYDTRTAGSAVVAAARRTHPGTGVYEDPLRIAAELDAVPLPPPPPDATRCPPRNRSPSTPGPPPADCPPPTPTCSPPRSPRPPPARPVTRVLLWGDAPACVCELRSPRRVDDPLAGFVPRRTRSPPRPGAVVRRQVCAYVDVRDEGAGAAVRLQYA
ncbi:hypothetical protein StrepF001_29245 [Streptomyces sp. F001]|uniref:MEDS domain-containing protein n=1 Tax=Streptomyces sp. F001 TaxID=1510026 RepID=UPI00101E49D7|nr:MEDS domain-containing protein [Streptomyces sp. F001]RZB15848.1 hypothetical protein StrepF001_29245 [Streptomyces sp. F001]